VKALHNLLRRQMRRLGLAPGRPPDEAAWNELLERVSQTYGDADHDRYLLERSQDISSREMRELNEALQHERDRLESRVRERTAELAASEARFRSFTSLGSDWYWAQDAQFRFTAITGHRVEISGVSEEHLLGAARWDLPYVLPPDGGWDAHRACLARHEAFHDVVLERRLPDGSATYAAISGEPFYDDDGQFSGYRGIGRDITRQKLAEAHVNRLAHFDALTGLLNRAAFFDRAAHALALARRHQRGAALLFIDFDRFKDVNDAFGHAAGDDVLRTMARRLDLSTRDGDTVARLGGDEFIVLIEEVTDVGDVRQFGQRLLETLAEPFVVDGQECRLSASIGIALFPGDGEDHTTLLKKADLAMYRAKESGRNTATFFAETGATPAADRIVLGAGLRRALETGQLRLLFQPKVSLRTGKLTGVEALVRWQHPERGLLLPADFIPAAEDSGLIRPLGAWVLRAACKQAVHWRYDGQPPIRVAVNLSARQFRDQRLLAEVARALADTELPPELLEIEITESMMMEQPDRAADTLRAVQAMGVHVSIDDFGTGYSSLARLKKFPLQSVKIDHSFIRDVTEDPDDAAIVSAVIAMAHSLRLQVVAEGVETLDQVRFLQQRGCDEIQGFYFSPPVPAADIRGVAATFVAQPPPRAPAAN
jgi:diguanylate cyclase (GGDEF)-like protein/PAS domain S-box-containing protein